MKFIVISPEQFTTSNEVKTIRHLIAGGITVHIRKQEDELKIAQFLSTFPEEERQSLTIHRHVKLAEELKLGGIHLTGNQAFKEIPENWSGRVSKSCHSIEEINGIKYNCDYVFLSPIFDSISKPGYSTAFKLEDLAMELPKISQEVIALGGVTLNHLETLENTGFDGAAFLGSFWNLETTEQRLEFIQQLTGHEIRA